MGNSFSIEKPGASCLGFDRKLELKREKRIIREDYKSPEHTRILCFQEDCFRALEEYRNSVRNLNLSNFCDQNSDFSREELGYSLELRLISSRLAIGPTHFEREQQELEYSTTTSPMKAFCIFYSYSTNEYRIKDLGIGPGVYIKIDISQTLSENQLIQFGKTSLIITSQWLSKYSLLRIHVYGGGYEGEIFEFIGRMNETRTVKVGRSLDNDITVDDNKASKIQSTLVFVEKQWMVVDGDLEMKKKSRNGTWIHPSPSLQLTQKTLIKFNESLFTVKTMITDH